MNSLDLYQYKQEYNTQSAIENRNNYFNTASRGNKPIQPVAPVGDVGSGLKPTAPQMNVGDYGNMLTEFLPGTTSNIGMTNAAIGLGTGAAKGIGAIGSFLGGGNPIAGILGGTLGGIAAFQQGKAENKAINKMIGGLEDSKDRFLRMQNRNIGAGKGRANDLTTLFALNKDPNARGQLAGAYDTNIQSTNQVDMKLGADIAQTEQKIEGLEGQLKNTDQLAMSTIGGIFSGASNMGNLFAKNTSNQLSSSINKQLTDKLKSDPNLLSDLYKFNRV